MGQGGGGLLGGSGLSSFVPEEGWDRFLAVWGGKRVGPGRSGVIGNGLQADGV